MSAAFKLPDNFEKADEQPPVLEWTMADGVFVKVIEFAKRGGTLLQHSHGYDHTTFVAAGSVRLWADGEHQGDLVAPIATLIKAGVKHTYQALEDKTYIACIHNLHGEEAVKILEEHGLIGEV